MSVESPSSPGSRVGFVEKVWSKKSVASIEIAAPSVEEA